METVAGAMHPQTQDTRICEELEGAGESPAASGESRAVQTLDFGLLVSREEREDALILTCPAPHQSFTTQDPNTISPSIFGFNLCVCCGIWWYYSHI
jgi:hypothetical protein